VIDINNLLKSNIINERGIQQAIIDILKTRFKIDCDNISNEEMNELWGKTSALSAIDMVYLVHLIEQAYDIKFSVSDYDSQDFYTLNGLAQVIITSNNDKG
jgi:acyl carrier protein